MTQQLSDRQCLFCGLPANSREHVIAEWLSKRMGVRNHEFHPARLSEGVSLKTYPGMKAEHFRTRQVCESCNNGWMSDLESWFQKRLGFLVEPSWPILADSMIVCLRQDSEFLVRWMIKSAVVFERAVPKGKIQVVPDPVRDMAKSGKVSNDFFVMLGHIVAPGFTAHLVKGFPVWNGGVLHPYQQHADGFSFTVYLNHLAIRLIRCPGASPNVKATVQLQGAPVCPFWVNPPRNYAIPTSHSFPSFELFLDALEVHTGTSAS